MGKGRQIAGVCFENFLRGKNRAVWFSASADLADDARRDFSDIGAGKIPIGKMLSFKAGTDIRKSFPKGVMFCTYTALVSGTGEKKR